MGRPVTLFTGQWADLSFDTMLQKGKEFGYDGLELACWGDHFEVDKADQAYCDAKRAALDAAGMKCYAISTHLVGQAVCDNIEATTVLIDQRPPAGDSAALVTGPSGRRYLLTGGLEDYRIAGISDVGDIHVEFMPGGFENARGRGVGLGELCTLPALASISNAVWHATGWRPRALPLTPDRVLSGLRDTTGPMGQTGATR